MRLAQLTLCVLAIASSEAQAITRYTSTSMSCEEVKQTIREDGAAIMRYASTRKPGLPRYGRYVSNRNFCRVDEITTVVAIPSADKANCLVRECEHYDFDDDALIFRRRH